MTINPPSPLRLSSIYQADALLEQWRGRRARCTQLLLLQEGPSGVVYRLRLGADPFDAILKIAPLGDDSLRRQADGHRFLRLMSDFPCPDVYHVDCSGTVVPFGFLLLEFIPGSALNTLSLAVEHRHHVERELAGVLRRLHSNTRDTFGGIDGAAATTRWSEILAGWMADMRHEMIAHLCADTLADIDRAVAAIPEVFADQGRPTLVHGDVWDGNIIVAERPDGWHMNGIVDVGAQYADVELEISYLEAFETAGSVFFDAYCSVNPLRPGYEFRRLFYHLKTQMTHVWLFGDQSYKDHVVSLARQICVRL